MKEESFKWGRNEQMSFKGSLPQSKEEKMKNKSVTFKKYGQPKGKTVNPRNNNLNFKGVHEIHGNIKS